MASAIIHLAVAKKVNEKLQMDEKQLLLGSIAPDVSKLIGLGRPKSHFVTEMGSSIPDIDYFLSKYKDELKNPYEMGYFIHLLTDKLWFGDYLKNYVNDLVVTDKKGRCYTLPEKDICDILYNDYSNMNVQLIDYYNMDLSLFYEDFEYPESHIKELPGDYFDALIDKLGEMCIKSSKQAFLLDIASIVHFIEYCTVYVLDEIEKLK